jgi:hypothetical protein
LMIDRIWIVVTVRDKLAFEILICRHPNVRRRPAQRRVA